MKGVYRVWTSVTQNMVLEPALSILSWAGRNAYSLVSLQFTELESMGWGPGYSILTAF